VLAAHAVDHLQADLLGQHGLGGRVAARRPVTEAVLTEQIGLQMVYGVGGEHKSDSSTRINAELSLADTPAEPAARRPFQ